MIELYFSTVKILAQRPTHIFAVATILLITKTFTVKYYYRRIETNTASVKIKITINKIIITTTCIKPESDCNGNGKKEEKKKKAKKKAMKTTSEKV